MWHGHPVCQNSYVLPYLGCINNRHINILWVWKIYCQYAAKKNRPLQQLGPALVDHASSLIGIVYIKLDRMRCVFQTDHVFHLQVNVGVDLFISENISLCEEAAVFVQ